MGRVGPVRPSLETMARTGLWPTPTGGVLREPLAFASQLNPTWVDAKASGSRNTPNSKAHPGVSLTDAVRQDGGHGRWPTPAARDWRSGRGRSPNGHTRQLPEQAGGQLNPTWVEWLLGYPTGWTDCAASETRSSRKSRNSLAERLTIIPLTWKQACRFTEALHRHHRPPRGAKFALGVVDRDGTLHGIALCCRPIARVLDDGLTLEVNRTATDGCPNANSALYGACWRVAAAMGYRRIITYTQAGETGASLTASGYVRVRDLPARGSWAASSVALKHLRDAVGTGSVERILWRRGDQLGLELTAPRRL